MNRDPDQMPETHPRARWLTRRRAVAFLVGTVAAVSVGVAVAVQMQPDSPGPTDVAIDSSPDASGESSGEPSGRTGALSDGGASSCAEAYSSEAVTTRAFAFDGTVVDIGPGQTNRAAGGELDLAGVTFEVKEWFHGGDTGHVTVDMSAPSTAGGAITVGGEGSESGPSYEIGSRLLVSGEPRWGGVALKDAIAWGCGFTRYYDEQTAASWR